MTLDVPFFEQEGGSWNLCIFQCPRVCHEGVRRALRGRQVSDQRHQGQVLRIPSSLASDVSQPSWHKTFVPCICASSTVWFIFRDTGPPSPAVTGQGCCSALLGRNGFEHELSQLMMGSWDLLALKFPAPIFCYSHPKMKPLRVSLWGSTALLPHLKFQGSGGWRGGQGDSGR